MRCRTTWPEEALFSYTNTSSQTERIKSITMKVGTGYGDFYDQPTNGSGAPLKYWLNSNGLRTNTASVTNRVTATGTNKYPNRAEMQSVTLTFSDVHTVPAGGTEWFGNDFLRDSENDNNGCVFCWDNTTCVVNAEPYTEPEYYTVAFDMNGGAIIAGEEYMVQKVKPGGTAIPPTPYIPDGIRFVGWDKPLTNIQSDQVIKAIWAKEIDMKVTFEPNGGTRVGGGELVQWVPIGGDAVPPILELPGSEFGGWDKPYTNIRQDTVITARWMSSALTVTFDPNGGERVGGGPLQQTVSYGGDATPPILEREGYDFQGWDSDYRNITSSKVITAQWSIITYSIYYHSNSDEDLVHREEKIHGEDIALLGNMFVYAPRVTFNPQGGSVTPSYRDINLTFKCWSDAPYDGNAFYAPGAIYDEDHDLHLYAIWNPGTVGQLPTPIMQDAEFIGWYTMSHNGVRVDNHMAVTKPIILYAYYKYKIFYHVPSGECDLEPQIKEYDVSLILRPYIPERRGYEFLGWSRTQNATSPEYRANATFTTNAVTHLYAVWRDGIFTVKFELLEGFFEPGGGELVQAVRRGNDAVPPATPRHETKQFRGWLGDYRNVDSNRTIRAMWKASFLWRWNGTQWERLYD